MQYLLQEKRDKTLILAEIGKIYTHSAANVILDIIF